MVQLKKYRGIRSIKFPIHCGSVVDLPMQLRTYCRFAGIVVVIVGLSRPTAALVMSQKWCILLVDVNKSRETLLSFTVSMLPPVLAP